MISVCVPIYNFDVSRLVEKLEECISKTNVAIELLFIDDCSEEHFREVHRKICKNHQYDELIENVGRSVIRNLFVSKARYTHLLFLDCDGLPISDDFLNNYVSLIEKEAVICGGRHYPKEKPSDKNTSLSWKYGTFVESKSANIRNVNANKSFMTNNFMIQKSVFEKIRFDERLSGYGHEDTLFGLELSDANISVLHIENPVLNLDIEENKLFLSKTEAGLRNLNTICQLYSDKNKLIENISLLKAVGNLGFFKPFFRGISFLILPVLRWILKLPWASLKVFALYKLLYFIRITSKKRFY